ncbi:hypothetical protein KP509_19G032900 [Ceratopteris richardii]|uniref:Uncharacterized protein n=1 Tax=Ceratopteris richardii TaxID=49495 RepID=A0A8T2SMU1_CERRI|nr:hypothetical protein KP509_19G032900 [Ceratopteris richardii]
MAFFFRRLLVAPLIFINFILYISVAAIAGWALNQAIDLGWEAVSYNPVTFYLVMFALLAGVVGIGSTFSAIHHLRTWHYHSLASSNAATYISWLLTLLAMGIAIKQIMFGGFLTFQMRLLEALVIIVAVTHLLYLLGVGASAYRGEYVIKTRETIVDSPTPAPATTKE